MKGAIDRAGGCSSNIFVSLPLTIGRTLRNEHTNRQPKKKALTLPADFQQAQKSQQVLLR